MNLHREVHFENDIGEHLAASGWLYSPDDAGFDRELGVYPPDLLEWLRETQPKAWETLVKDHGSRAEAMVLKAVRSALNSSGTLDVLRFGFDVFGHRKPLLAAQFRPALNVNPEITARYAANRLRVIRQVHYSPHHQNSLDLVLLLNGIPVATAELKTDFTQSIDDAVDQYRFDRLPTVKGKGSTEPLLAFPGGAVVHFAVSSSEVRMTTKLEGEATRFLPFNLGNDGAAGNPPNPAGYRTSYLWEQIWQRDSWLEILGRYMVGERNDKKQLTGLIFPRFHQLDATRKLVAAVLKDGPGSRYLIQHSAGSGKTNSIAWSAHFLADLHDASNRKVFDSVLVISDRNVIDTQLQDAIFSFERTTGVVATIKGEGGSKSGELATALSGGKKIIVCTIQTFPYAIKAVRELAATEGKRFAVIADEAHSSQAGEAAAKLKRVLSPEEVEELADGGEFSTEDLLAAQMEERAKEDGVTYVAFTATPKAKTLELFGTRPDPSRKPAPDNIPRAFHVYSMQQAIEEGFILDVLQNYVTYKLAFKLAHNGKELDDREVERAAAMKGIMGWVRLHPYNISQKVQIVVEHYREHVAPLLGGKAKAMVVVSSRVEAVRWQLAIEKYSRSKGYPIHTLVAFSGEVSDPESGPDAFTEGSATLNPGLKGRSIKEAFNTPEFQILLAANKFQTGFDQPLLCGMYVDKRLAGIQAVQTLSRLNRAAPGKDTTYVVDFVNEGADVLEAFQTYYRTAELSGVSDPNVVLELKAKLDQQGYYDQYEVDRVVTVVSGENNRQQDLDKAIQPVAERLLSRFKQAKQDNQAALQGGDTAKAEKAKAEMDALLLFRTDIGTYVRVYTFLSQMVDFGSVEIEKRAIFFRMLVKLLKYGQEREGVDLSQVRLTHHNLKPQGKQAMRLGEEEYPQLDPLGELGGGQVREKGKAYLREIIRRVNELFEGELSDGDKLVYVNDVIKGKLLESETLVQQAANNSKEQFSVSPDLRTCLKEAIMAALDAHTTMSTQALQSDAKQEELLSILLGPAGLYESLRSLGKTG
jgi:type I restriction enzyme R subunit